MQVLTIAFRYLPVETLKTCRFLNKTLHHAATKCLMGKTFVRLDNSSSLLRYVQDAASMQTIWENYKIVISNKLSSDLLLQFGSQFGSHVKAMELDIRFREISLSYLEDLFSDKLSNLQEFTLKGKFPNPAVFINPLRMYGKLEKLQVFNLFAKGWHRLPPLPNGEVIFKSQVIGHILAAMPNLTKINYFPDVDSPREAHRHYSNFLLNLAENESVVLNKLKEIQHFTLSFIDVPCMEKFALKGFPLQKLHILVEEEVEAEALCLFLETFRNTLTHLVIRSATENPIKWPRLLRLEELALIGVNVHGTDFISYFPSLKNLHVSQDRVTTVDLSPERSLQVPHTLTCLKIIEGVAVNGAYRLSDNGLSILFRDLPFLMELAIVQNFDSSQPTFSDEGVTGAKLSVSSTELSIRPRDLRVTNRNLMRFSHFIGSLAGTFLSLICG